MNNNNYARQTEIDVTINGTNVTSDINSHLLSLTYTDTEDENDDLRIELDDREGTWLEWLRGAKGSTISASIIQRGDGDKALDCGVFEIDSVGHSGPPSKMSIRATSLPYSSTVRNTTTTKEWENIGLSAIASEIAENHGMECMFLSSFSPTYTRRSQMQVSDVVFLEKLCRDAGISLKVTDNTIVLFDEHEYEQRASISMIVRGSSDVLSWNFNTSMNETKYSACQVSYTDPNNGETVEYTFTPPGANPSDPVLEINEKVETREEAHQKAKKRLREKNKNEYQASFTLVGDVKYVAGATVDIAGWGFYNGKYIIEKAVHSVGASGFTTQIQLHRVLEGY